MSKLTDVFNNYTLENLKNIDKESFLKKHQQYQQEHKESITNRDGDFFDIFPYQWDTFDFEKGEFTGDTLHRAYQILDYFINNQDKYEDKDYWKDKDILNIGSHCGLECLALKGLGARSVTCIDEHDKLIEVSRFMIDSFGLENCTVLKENMFNIPKNLDKKFDVVYFSGVLYHLSDPYRGLRIIYNSLKESGAMFLETYALLKGVGNERTVEYHGPSIPGWNWFLPSSKCCEQMAKDAGFDNVVGLDYWDDKKRRFCMYSKKYSQKKAQMYAGVAGSEEL